MLTGWSLGSEASRNEMYRLKADERAEVYLRCHYHLVSVKGMEEKMRKQKGKGYDGAEEPDKGKMSKRINISQNI
eukprot:scaffold93995_cov20-Tisochrysis_lutea.AAC.1